MKQVSMLFATLIICLTSCGKDNGVGNMGGAPTNLSVTATVNPDNSGNVSFTATATNASTYDFNFGNGSFQTVSSGSYTYKYGSSGTYTVTVTAKNAQGQSTSKTISVTVTVTQTLVWSDEFNTNGAPDPAKWGYDLGTGDNGWGNNELEYYTSRPDNSVVSNGSLKITAKKESFSGSNYTSARLLSKGKYAFKYGRVEVSAKLPAGVGSWPAIWMLGDNISIAGWPACGEIDIMEHRGSELNKIFGTLHYPGRSGANADGGTKQITNATSEFHKYTMDWSPAFIKIYVDDQLFHTVTNSNNLPFNQDFFFIMNVAIGGNFAGAVDPALTSATMEVDYIRVYK